MKRFVCMVMAVLCLSLTVSAQMGGSSTIQDLEGFMYDGEHAEISQLATEFNRRHDMNVVVVVTGDSEGLSPRQYSERVYHGYHDTGDGLMLYINMVDRDLYILSSGRATEYFSDRDINRLLDHVADAMINAPDSVSMPFAGSQMFLQLADKHIASKRQSGGGDIALGAVIIGLSAGLVAVLVMLALHKRSFPAPPGAHAYMCKEGLRVTRQKDTFLHTRTVRVRIQKNNSSGGGFGGGVGGGRSFGGGGRKF